MLKIIGMGTGSPDEVTTAAREAIKSARAVFVQTEKLPQLMLLQSMDIEWSGMDELFQRAENYEQLNAAIVDRLLQSAAERDTAYCVFGSGLEGQQAALDALAAARQRGIDAGVVPGVSAVSTAAALAGQPHGYRAVFGDVDILHTDTGAAQVIGDVDRQIKAADTKVKLLELYAEDTNVTIIHFGGGRPAVQEVQLHELDRLAEYTPYTFVVVPPSPYSTRARYNMADLVEICHILRSPGGCPWDREQSHTSLKRNMLEEAQEAVCAIDEADPDHLCEELGDVLLQVALHSEIADEHAEFGILDVTSGICDKMIRRHPHVFADVKVRGTGDVLSNWEMIKAAEPGHGQKGFGSGAVGLPGLMRAHKLQKEAAKFGFDWDEPAQAIEKLHEEIGEFLQALDETPERAEAEAGDMIFAAVNAARLAGVDSETAAIGCCDRFSRRIQAMQAFAGRDGKALSDYDLTEQNSLWERAKSEE